MIHPQPTWLGFIRRRLSTWLTSLLFLVRYSLALKARHHARQAIPDNPLPFGFRTAVEVEHLAYQTPLREAINFCASKYAHGDKWIVGEGWESDVLPRFAALAFFNNEGGIRAKVVQWMAARGYNEMEREDLLDFLESIDQEDLAS